MSQGFLFGKVSIFKLVSGKAALFWQQAFTYGPDSFFPQNFHSTMIGGIVPLRLYKYIKCFRRD